MKIKLFSGTTKTSQEKLVNDFISQKGIKVIDIKMSFSGEHVVIMVVYEEITTS